MSLRTPLRRSVGSVAIGSRLRSPPVGFAESYLRTLPRLLGLGAEGCDMLLRQWPSQPLCEGTIARHLDENGDGRDGDGGAGLTARLDVDSLALDLTSQLCGRRSVKFRLSGMIQASIIFLLRKRRRVQGTSASAFCRSTIVLGAGAFLIVTLDPAIKIDLEIGDRAVDLLAKGDAIELIEHRLVGTARRCHSFAGSWSWCANGRYPRAPGRAHIRGARGCRIIFRAAIGQHAADLPPPRIIERHHAIVDEISRGDGRLAIIELGLGRPWRRCR